jgi:lipid A 4'-phosphatase
MLAPPPWRGLAIGAAAVFAGGVGLLRMAAGAHFFTDILIGALVTILIVLALNRLIVGASGLRPERNSRT